MGTLFMVNPPRKRRRTAAQRRATAKMIAANKRRRRGTTKKTRRRRKNPTAAQRRARYRRSLTVGHGAKRQRRKTSKTTSRKRARTMAAKRRTAKRGRRRTSTKRRRTGVSTLRRHSVYLTNPRRRRRNSPARARSRHRRRRNPPLFATLQQGAMDAGATLVGGAVARTVSGMLPIPKDGIMGVATGMAVAVGVGFVARKVVSADRARFIVAGAMQVPIKSLITTFVPGAGAFLGDYDNVGAYALPNGVGDYLNPGGMYASPQDVEISAYE